MKLARLELFYSPMCAICPWPKMIVRQIEDEERDKYNVTRGRKKAQRYGIRSVPYSNSGLPTKEAILKTGLVKEGK